MNYLNLNFHVYDWPIKDNIRFRNTNTVISGGVQFEKKSCYFGLTPSNIKPRRVLSSPFVSVMGSNCLLQSFIRWNPTQSFVLWRVCVLSFFSVHYVVLSSCLSSLARKLRRKGIQSFQQKSDNGDTWEWLIEFNEGKENSFWRSYRHSINWSIRRFTTDDMCPQHTRTYKTWHNNFWQRPR